MNSLLAILLLVAIYRCSAFPTQAGSCKPGKYVFTNSYGQNSAHTGANVAQLGSQALGNAGFQVFIDGRQLYPDKLFKFTAGVEHTIKLIGTGDIMKGFLMRLESVDNQDTRDALYSSDGRVQKAFACTNQEFVGGLSHVNNQAKTMVEGKLFVDEPSDLMLLDVTTVVTMLYYLLRSEFYMSQFRLQAVPKGTAISYSVGSTTSTPAPKDCLNNGEGCSQDGSCCGGRCIRENTQNIYAAGYCTSGSAPARAPVRTPVRSPVMKAPPAPTSQLRPKGSACVYNLQCASRRCTKNVCASVPTGGPTKQSVSGNKGGGSNRNKKRMLRRKRVVANYFTPADMVESLGDAVHSMLVQ